MARYKKDKTDKMINAYGRGYTVGHPLIGKGAAEVLSASHKLYHPNDRSYQTKQEKEWPEYMIRKALE